MAYVYVTLVMPNVPIYPIRMEDSEATDLAAHFMNTPDPPKKHYTIWDGNITAGFTEGHLLIDWSQADIKAVHVKEATEQPPPG